MILICGYRLRFMDLQDSLKNTLQKDAYIFGQVFSGLGSILRFVLLSVYVLGLVSAFSSENDLIL